jgi:GMP synthase (glutamine-hydrolysing)
MSAVINALSGGVDSSVVTALGHRALGKQLKTYFIDNGIMQEKEPRKVAAVFRKLGIPITIVDARADFFEALKGVVDPEEKREAITQTFYRKVFGDRVKKSGARFLLQETILTDVEETVAGVSVTYNIRTKPSSTIGAI